MTRPSWERVEELFHAALARPPGEREAFLASASGADEALRREVLSLLAHEAQAEGLLEEPALGAATEKLALLTGSRLGPYEVLGLLGAGGMGEVYRARDARLSRLVAIKVLPASLAGDPERLRRFEREARAVAALSHPHVLTVHDVGTHDGAPYVVTELLEGETLREVLKRRAVSPRQAIGFVLQAAQGLSAVHKKGIVHRDLKPENLFLTTDGRIKVLDFGLAHGVGRARQLPRRAHPGSGRSPPASVSPLGSPCSGFSRRVPSARPLAKPASPVSSSRCRGALRPRLQQPRHVLWRRRAHTRPLNLLSRKVTRV